MGYTAQRAAPLGAVSAAVATAAFFGFHPDRLTARCPTPGALTTPAAALSARLGGANAALRRLWGEDVVDAPETAEAAELAWQAAMAADCAAGCWPRPTRLCPARPTHLALWQAATTLREHRGDGHIAALVARGISPVASHLIKAAAGESEPGGAAHGPASSTRPPGPTASRHCGPTAF